MRYLLLCLLLVGCAPREDDSFLEPSNPIETSKTTGVDPWLVKFKQTHGTDYDPLSRVDREKMDKLKGSTVVAAPAPKDKKDYREAVLSVARPLVGQTETHGSNRSPVIDKMNTLTGVALGSPYCASFNAWCYTQAGAPGKWTKSAWSPDWVKSPTWRSSSGGTTPKPADTFGIWFSNLGRVAHTGMIESWGTSSAVTVEANTSPSAEFGGATDRDGDGIWRKRRLRSQIYSVRNWIDQ